MIREVHERLQIDEQWSTWSDRGFAWIAHRLQQTVTTSRPMQDGEFTLFRLLADTPVVDAVSASEETIDRVLSDLNRYAFGSCYSFVPEERAIYATTSTWLHQDTAGWRAEVFGTYAIGQLCFAEVEADYLADQCDGRVAVRALGDFGHRSDPDDMLNVVDAVLSPQGHGPSRFANAFEFEAVADMVQRTETAATIGGSADGIALETTFGDYTALGMLLPEGRHRRLGAGLATRIHLPVPITSEDGHRIAAMLNRHERVGGSFTAHSGAWCVDNAPPAKLAVTYRNFLPNVMYRGGLIMDASMGCVTRMRWSDQAMNMTPATESPWARLASRLGMRDPEG
jgi:hypothetical protein